MGAVCFFYHLPLIPLQTVLENKFICLTVIPSASKTYEDVEPNGFNISYVDGSGSSGNYFQDVLTIGGGTLNNFEMGLATTSSIGTGIMGIGYNTSEANVDTGNHTEYPNLPLAMVNQGLINSAAYSLWLNDLRKSIFLLLNFEREVLICE